MASGPQDTIACYPEQTHISVCSRSPSHNPPARLHHVSLSHDRLRQRSRHSTPYENMGTQAVPRPVQGTTRSPQEYILIWQLSETWPIWTRTNSAVQQRLGQWKSPILWSDQWAVCRLSAVLLHIGHYSENCHSAHRDGEQVEVYRGVQSIPKVMPPLWQAVRLPERCRPVSMKETF